MAVLALTTVLTIATTVEARGNPFRRATRETAEHAVEHVGTLVGISLGALAGAVLIGFATWYFWPRDGEATGDAHGAGAAAPGLVDAVAARARDNLDGEPTVARW